MQTCVFFVLYLLAAFVFFEWPALLTFGFSGNLALLILVFGIAMIVMCLSK